MNLDADGIRGELSEIHFTEEAIRQLIRTAQMISSDPELLSYYDRYYREEILTGKWEGVWDIENPAPLVENAFQKQYTLFYLLCYLKKIEETKNRYQELGIPKEVYTDTLSDIGVWLENWKERYGYYCFRNLGWIWRHLDARLFRIGRLQYQLSVYGGDIVAFRNRKTGLIIAFSTQEMAVNSSGDLLGSGGCPDDSVWFTAKPVCINDTFVHGYAITPYGKVGSKPVSLPLSEWEKVFGAGEKVLQLHIPRSGEFTPDNCRDSYRRALDFYKQYFQEMSIRGLICHTWIFTPQLQEMLAPDSNLVRFQREFYLLPNAGSYQFMWNFVFHETITKDNAPRKTSLQRLLLKYLEEGRPLFDLKGMLLHGPESWGSQMYMSSYDNGYYGEWVEENEQV